MKKIILMAFVICLAFFNAKAQTPATNINAKVETSRKANGDVLIHTEEGKFKVYASFKKSKATGYYAVDMTGNRISPTYEAKGVTPRCFFCIHVNGDSVCYEVECTNIPPLKKAAIKVRN